MEKNDPVRKQLELNTLIEFSQLVSSKLDLRYILNNILLSTMGKLLISRGIVLIKSEDENDSDGFLIEAVKGLDLKFLGKRVAAELPKLSVFEFADLERGNDFSLKPD